MADFVLKRNDRLPVLTASLKNADGTALNLSPGGTTVKFLMALPSATSAKVDATAVITDGAGGVVQYAWTAADVDSPGDYQAEFEVTWASGLKQTFPNSGYLHVAVLKDLA